MADLIPDWADRAAQIAALQAQIKADQAAVAALARVYEDGVYDYADLILRNRLLVDIPCGVLDLHTHGMSGAPRTFWNFLYVRDEQVWFTHDCAIHQDGRTGCEDLSIPLMFFTHRQEWLTLAVLAGEDPR